MRLCGRLGGSVGGRKGKRGWEPQICKVEGKACTRKKEVLVGIQGQVMAAERSEALRETGRLGGRQERYKGVK